MRVQTTRGEKDLGGNGSIKKIQLASGKKKSERDDQAYRKFH